MNKDRKWETILPFENLSHQKDQVGQRDLDLSIQILFYMSVKMFLYFSSIRTVKQKRKNSLVKSIKRQKNLSIISHKNQIKSVN